jgi:hypothetical protein
MSTKDRLIDNQWLIPVIPSPSAATVSAVESLNGVLLWHKSSDPQLLLA